MEDAERDGQGIREGRRMLENSWLVSKTQTQEGRRRRKWTDKKRRNIREEEKGDATRQEEQWKTKEAPHSALSYLSDGLIHRWLC